MNEQRPDFAGVLMAHQRIPIYDGTEGQRCVGCDNLTPSLRSTVVTRCTPA